MLTYCLCLLALGTASAPATAPANPEGLRTLVEGVVRPHLPKTVGLVVGVIRGDRREVFSFGKASDKSDAPPDGDTLFEIGSVTKTFTSLLLADMVHRGEVKLEDPVRLYVPEGVRVPARNGSEIRLVDLATHVSGLPRLPAELILASTFMYNPYERYRPEVMYKSLSDYELPRDIGAAWEYSNFGVGLLGQCLARKADRPYEELVLERICRPLGMHSTCIRLSPELRERFARGHSAPGQTAEPWELAAITPAGGIRSSANDMMNYLAAQMGTLPTPLAGAIEMTHVVRTRTDMDHSKQALGWLVLTIPGHSHKVIWHNGGTGGYACWASFVKETKIGVIVLSNCVSDGTADLIGVALASSLDRQASAATSSSAPAE